MKTPRWFTRNRLSSQLRVATAVTLMSAAAAMAFVAVKTSTSTSHAKPSLSDLRVLHRRDAFETSQGGLNRSRSGEPESSAIHNGRAQEHHERSCSYSDVDSIERYGCQCNSFKRDRVNCL